MKGVVLTGGAGMRLAKKRPLLGQLVVASSDNSRSNCINLAYYSGLTAR